MQMYAYFSANRGVLVGREWIWGAVCMAGKAWRVLRRLVLCFCCWSVACFALLSFDLLCMLLRHVVG